MKHLTSIVALNRHGAIGCQNQLPWRLKTDMDFFREKTTRHIVIMGRKTYESIGRPLPNRYNIVMSHNAVLFPFTENSRVVTSISEALYVASRLRGYRKSEVFIVGGSQIYSLFSEFVDRYIFTMVERDVPNADAFFDESLLGNRDCWRETHLKNISSDPERDDANFNIYQYDFEKIDTKLMCRRMLIEGYQERVVNQPQSRQRPEKKSMSNWIGVGAI